MEWAVWDAKKCNGVYGVGCMFGMDQYKARSKATALAHQGRVLGWACRVCNYILVGRCMHQLMLEDDRHESRFQIHDEHTK